MANVKLSQITTSAAAPASTDTLVGVTTSATDNLFSLAQVFSSIATQGQALTRTNDTNVTLTLGGGVTSSLVNAASITVGWSGLLAESRGGTNNAFFKVTGPTTSSKAYTFPDSSQKVAMLDLADQVVTGGANVTSATLTSTSFTVDCGKCPLQSIANTTAITITAPTNEGSCMIMITNGAGASSVTFSGFSVGSNTGDALDTTTSHSFTVSVWRINSTSGYRIAAHQ